MSKPTSQPLRSLLFRIVYALILGAITVFVLKLLFGKPTFADWYAAILKPVLALLYLLILPSFLLIITGHGKARWLRLSVNIVSVLVLLVAALLLIGSLQTSLGVACPGDTGCIQNQILIVSLLFIPQIFLPTVVILAAFFIKGLMDEREEAS